MRRLALIFCLLASACAAAAGGTNYFCVVCGQGPLTGRIWLHQWGAVCATCYQLANHCSLCGLPIGKDFVKTADGRFICKFDRPNVVLDVAEAREVFTAVRRELIGLFGSGFALNYPEVSVNLFDVDYWSEQGRSDGLHKFGFSSTRKSATGECTHQVVLLSGRLRDEIAAAAAHEYTHLWINENRPASHAIEPDTVEAICELTAYKLMESRARPAQQRRILDNSYTHGEIKKLVALAQENRVGYVLNWVKNGTAPNFDSAARTGPAEPPAPRTFTNISPAGPETLRLGGLLLDGQSRHALINGVAFAAGEGRTIRLAARAVRIKCREIRRNEVVLEVAGLANPMVLKIGEEKFVP